MQRVAAYARVSTDHEDQETSLSAHTDYYKKKILEHPGCEFVEIYVDDGVSDLLYFLNSFANSLTAYVFPHCLTPINNKGFLRLLSFHFFSSVSIYLYIYVSKSPMDFASITTKVL